MISQAEPGTSCLQSDELNYKEILVLLERVPFAPFRIVLTDGKTYDIRHPDFIWVLPTRLEIATPMRKGGRAIERTDHVSLLHIVRLEEIKRAAKGGRLRLSP